MLAHRSHQRERVLLLLRLLGLGRTNVFRLEDSRRAHIHHVTLLRGWRCQLVLNRLWHRGWSLIDDSALGHRHTHRWHLCLILIWHGHLIGYERHLHHRVIGRLHEIRWRLHLRLLRAFDHILCATTATLVVAMTGIRLETHPACVHLIVVTGVRTHLVRVESTLVLLILAAPLRDSLTRRGSLHKTLARGVHWR